MRYRVNLMWISAAAALLLNAFCSSARADDQSLTGATIVVYNRTLSESASLAKFYAQRRGISRDHLVPIACPQEEEISREDYDTWIAAPLRATFRKKGWWKLLDNDHPENGVESSKIQFVVLMKGMPLKIRNAAAYKGDKPGGPPTGDRNEASVDAEIAVLGRYSKEISGPQQNPYFKSSLRIADFADPSLLLVCRLDAPSADTVRRMIVDSIATEKTGLWGRAYIDGAHNTAAGFEVGDKWLEDICAQLHKVGVPLVYEDTPAVFPVGYPMSNCALYYGWYAGSVAGPFAEPDFRFVPGAVAVHIHSFSAATLRDPKANWVGPLLQKGAAASLGNVYEPYLQLTANLDIFNDRLLQGFTLAESAYMSLRGLSWMSVVVGDPLYRPYASWQQLDSKRSVSKSASVWRTYHDFALANADKPTSEYRKAAREMASRTGNGPVLEDIGLMEVRDDDFASAVKYFQQARTTYTKLDDIIRVVLEQANALVKENKPNTALALVRSVLKVIPDSPAVGPLRQIEHDLAPAPARTPARTPNKP